MKHLRTLPFVLVFALFGCSGTEETSDGDAGADVGGGDVGGQDTADAPTPAENCFNTRDDDGDGAIDCADDDCADDPACAAPEHCSNGEDDDGDGLVDCDDDDCATMNFCTCPEFEVEGLGPFEGVTEAGASNLAGSCGGEGAEQTYLWTAPEDGTYTFDTLETQFDTVLYVLEGACDGAELGCNDDLRTTENCDIEGDEDEDGQADCDDDDCANSSLCNEDAPEDCTNESDDDEDGDVDCDDIDCAFDPACNWSTGVLKSRVTLDLTAGQTVVVVLDAYSGDETGASNLSITADAPATEAVCDDEIDDDIDGLLDCADPDCAAAEVCDEPCPFEDLGSALGDAVAEGDTSEHVRSFVGSCSSYFGSPYLGGGRMAPDVAYQWTAPAAGTYRFDTEGSELDSVLYARLGACDGPELDCNDDIDAEGENYQSELSLDLEADEVVFLIVDGWGFREGAFQLNISATTEPPEGEICDNEVDDDEDELVDCADDDCADDPACAVAEICDNEVDDDDDELVDCADDDCAGDPACGECSPGDYYEPDECNWCDCVEEDGEWIWACTAAICDDDAVAEICDNEADDDGDELVDCADPDCADDLACDAT